MISSSCKSAPEEVKKILNTKRFFKHQSPQKVPDYYLHNLKNVTVDGLWLEFGVWVGTLEGIELGIFVGTLEGTEDGTIDGCIEGIEEGIDDGIEDGALVGTPEGRLLG